jgi:hypothetical protein
MLMPDQADARFDSRDADRCAGHCERQQWLFCVSGADNVDLRRGS